MHLQHHCGCGGAGLTLGDIVRLYHVPRAVVDFAVLAGVGVDKLGAHRENRRCVTGSHHGLDAVIVHLLHHAGLCPRDHAQRAGHTQQGGGHLVKLFAVVFCGLIQIDRIGYHSFSHVFCSFQDLTYFMQTLPSTTTNPQDSRADTRATVLL